MPERAATGPSATDGIEIRPASSEDLPACERIWRDSLNDYLGRLGQPGIPEDNPALRRLHEHTLATDPGCFRVATRGEHVVAFGSAVRRGPMWFLSMLFVDPAEQARGLGRRLLAELQPARHDGILATATDSAQPVSNGLYASLGIVPRMPLLNAVGRPSSAWSPPALPKELEVGGLATGRLGPDGAPSFTEAVLVELAALDREVLGFDHPADHAFALRERPSAFAYRDHHGSLVGYGYTSPVGRIGPVAVRDATLLAPVLGHLLSAVEPRGASAIWLPGAAAPAIGLVLAAGLRFEDFPALVCWNRPFADFERYVPISPGLL